MIPLLLVLWCTTAKAGEDSLPDPTASLHPTDNIVALAKLRVALAAKPDDQHLLGLALMCYVNLCLSGEKEDDGADGPWLTYATALAQRRATARGGMPAADFAQAEPELWVRVLAGYRQEVADALARWPQDRERPGHRALLVLATGDWRTFTAKPPVTLHERYAALRTGFETAASSLTNHLSMQNTRHYPALVAKIAWRQGYLHPPQIIIEESVAFSAWMLASQELDDATALTLLGEFALALGVEVVPGESRTALWKRVVAASRDQEPLNARALGMAMRVCERFLDREAGMVAADGRLRLYGLGDLAAWNRDRLYSAAFFGYLIARSGHQDYARADREYVAVLREAAPRSVIAMRYGVGHQGMNFAPDDRPAAEYWDGLADAIAEEIARTPRHSSATLATALSKLAIGRPERAATLVRELVERDGLPTRSVIETLMAAAGPAGEVPLLLPALRHWSDAAPMDMELAKLRREWSPESHLFTIDGKPRRTWTDVTIDNRQLPWPGLELRQHFAIRWRGMLHIAEAGTYVLATESDDGSRLTVGEAVVDNSGDHGMRVRRVRIALEAGWLPLRLEYLQGTGEAGCRLLWQPPGGSGLVPIPAANLAQGSAGPAGLIADGFDLSDERRPGPTADAVAFATVRPWHLRAQEEIAEALFDVARYGEAVPFYRAMLVDPQRRHADQRLAQCLLWQDPADVDGALVVIRISGSVVGNWCIRSTAFAVRAGYRTWSTPSASTTRMTICGRWYVDMPRLSAGSSSSPVMSSRR